ncbi:MAG: hypothetical protein ACK5JN_02870 [Kluyvera sp.]|uniref:hypothetical protein n=1 Tax=Kluyvera sp. TaxID=1538228 RepID=UPI003A855F5D
MTDFDRTLLTPDSFRLVECCKIIGESQRNMYRRIKRREFFATRLHSWLVFVIVDEEKARQANPQMDLF